MLQNIILYRESKFNFTCNFLSSLQSGDYGHFHHVIGPMDLRPGKVSKIPAAKYPFFNLLAAGIRRLDDNVASINEVSV